MIDSKVILRKNNNTICIGTLNKSKRIINHLNKKNRKQLYKMTNSNGDSTPNNSLEIKIKKLAESINQESSNNPMNEISNDTESILKILMMLKMASNLKKRHQK